MLHKRPFLKRLAQHTTERLFSPLLFLITLLKIYFSYLGQRTASEKQAYTPFMLVGYARVSTGDQKLDLQLDALHAAGCERIFTGQISGSKTERPGLQEAPAYVRAGDTLVVWRLDRFGRSLKDLVAKVEMLCEREVGFRSLQESIDTTSPTGKLIFHIFGALAEFERDLVRERTMAGLASARARGREGGRPRSMDEQKLRLASRLMKDPELSVEEICEAAGVPSATLYRY